MAELLQHCNTKRGAASLTFTRKKSIIIRYAALIVVKSQQEQ